MLKSIYLLSSLLLLSVYSFAQTTKADSLQLEITKLKGKLALDSLKSIHENTLVTQKNTADFDARFNELKKEIVDLKTEKNMIKANLRDFHKEYRTGTVLSLSGLAAIILSTTLPQDRYSNKPNSLQLPLFVGGLISAVVGGFLRVDAHKFIGKAGKINLKL